MSAARSSDSAQMSGQRRQLHEIKTGGLSVAIRKARTVPIWFLAIIFFISIRLVRKIVLVRFDFIIPSRIGHLLITPGIYLGHRQIRTNMPNRRYIDFFYTKRADAGFADDWSANDFVLSKLRKRMRFLSPGLLSRVAKLNGKFGSPEHSMITKALPCDIRDLDDVFSTTKSPLWFTHNEEEKGHAILAKMGLSSNKPFACIYNRDNSYLSQVSPISDWSFYQYRNYPASHLPTIASALADRGLAVVRMGSHLEEKVSLLDPRIIEYSDSEFQSDFMDVFLSSRCECFIGSDSGLTVIPEVFRKPVGIVNHLPLSLITSNYSNAVVLPKILYDKTSNKPLTLRETLEFEKLHGYSADEAIFREGTIGYKFNTPEQLVDLVDETVARLRGTWVEDLDDKKLQATVWEHFDIQAINQAHGLTMHKTFRSIFSTWFLRKNQDWYLERN